MMPRLRQFTEFCGAPLTTIYRDFMMPHFLHFTDILQSPVYALLQTF